MGKIKVTISKENIDPETCKELGGVFEGDKCVLELEIDEKTGIGVGKIKKESI